MMIARQASYLIDWVIVGLIVIGGLFYFFGPRSLRTDEVIVVGLMILALIGFQIGLRRSRGMQRNQIHKGALLRLDSDEPQPPSPDLAVQSPA